MVDLCPSLALYDTYKYLDKLSRIPGYLMSRNRTIITQAPLRATTVGGGTDLPSFYRAYGPGATVPFAISKYVTIFVSHSFFPDKIRVSYSKTEIVKKVDEIEHPTVREALKLLNIEGGVEILSHSDIPSRGTGLGSSSTFLVALLHALHAWNGESVSQNELAAEAVEDREGDSQRAGRPAGRVRSRQRRNKPDAF